MVARGQAVLDGGMSAVVDTTLQRWFTSPFISCPAVAKVRARLLTDDPGQWHAGWRVIASHDALDRLPKLAIPNAGRRRRGRSWHARPRRARDCGGGSGRAPGRHARGAPHAADRMCRDVGAPCRSFSGRERLTEPNPTRLRDPHEQGHSHRNNEPSGRHGGRVQRLVRPGASAGTACCAGASNGRNATILSTASAAMSRFTTSPLSMCSSSSAYLATSGDNNTPWTKRIISRCNFIRAPAVQTYPGDALTSPAPRLVILRFADAATRVDDIILAARSSSAGPPVRQLRVFSASESGDVYVLAEGYFGLDAPMHPELLRRPRGADRPCQPLRALLKPHEKSAICYHPARPLD